MSTPSPSRRSDRLRGILGTVVYFTAVGALVAFLFQLAPDSDIVAEAPPTTTTTTSPAPPSTSPQVPVEAPSWSSEEPIADAAEVILPSVVHVQTSTGVGSGVIYDSSGLIITAAHVVGNDEEVQVRLSNGQLRTGRVLGSIPDVDIAVIETEPIDLPAAKFDSRKPRVGQLAIAVGSPWGLASTVTAGIISAVDQTNCGQFACAAMVQTDAAINPGNSGGALINRLGEVVGINVSIFTLSGANDGVGFAVPTSTVLAYADSIISGEPIQASFLGVQLGDVTSGRAGALITEVFPNTAAAEAGIEVGDVVIRVAGVPVLSARDLQAQVPTHRPGSTIDLVVLRDGLEMIIPVTLGIRSEDL